MDHKILVFSFLVVLSSRAVAPTTVSSHIYFEGYPSEEEAVWDGSDISSSQRNILIMH